MSMTVMPGLTPANARTSAGFSRTSRSRSLSVRAGSAMAASIGVAAMVNVGAARVRRAAISTVFMGFSLGALCESSMTIRNLIYRAGYSSWRTERYCPGAPMRLHNRIFVLALLLTTACTAFGAGSGDMATPSDQRPIPKSPETQAMNAYNAGVHLVEKADDLGADAARQTDEHKQKKTLDKARHNYSAALRKFSQAIEFQSGMYQAWNYLGYTQRKLGNYQDALIAYDRALSIKPGYAEAIEYRGHAYLGLNRLSEA